jgi:GT2 family glycosyltransferase
LPSGLHADTFVINVFLGVTTMTQVTGPSIGILVTNFNTWEITRRCVEACFAQDRGNFDQILVYDDRSTAPMNVSFPEGTGIFFADNNLGLTKSLNVAFRQMRTDIVVLFDSDSYPVTPFCDAIRAEFSSAATLGLLGLKTVGEHGQPTESFTTEPNQWSLLLGQALYAKYEKYLSDKSGKHSIFTCAMAVRATAFSQLGGFDENFDWLDLDHDFSMRMNRSNWTVRIQPTVLVFHKGGGTPQLTRKRVLRFYKNRWYLLRKFNRLPIPTLAKAVIVFRLWLEYAAFALLGPTLVKNKEVLQDKTEGRKEILRFCLEHY